MRFSWNAPPHQGGLNIIGTSSKASDATTNVPSLALDALFPWISKTVLRGIFRWRQERQVRNDSYLFSAMISHVGPISLSGFSAPGCIPTAVALLPFDAPGSAITLITTQHDKGLEIAASCPAATGGGGRLEVALDLLCAELGQGRNAKPVSIRPRRPTNRGRVPARPGRTSQCMRSSPNRRRLYPERIALSEGGQRLSYGRLERLAAACACRLRQQGVVPGDKVAVLAERRMESVIALLGILHLGASFVPLDPAWPSERIRFVLSDCRPTCLLSDETHSGLANPASSLMLSELMEPFGLDDFGFRPSSETPAYVLYTSGSTGKPKGVVVGQASILNYLLWAKEAYLTDMDVPTIFPFFTSLVFDLTLTSIFLPLCGRRRDTCVSADRYAADDTCHPLRPWHQCRQADALTSQAFCCTRDWREADYGRSSSAAKPCRPGWPAKSACSPQAAPRYSTNTARPKRPSAA